MHTRMRKSQSSNAAGAYRLTLTFFCYSTLTIKCKLSWEELCTQKNNLPFVIYCDFVFDKNKDSNELCR